MGKRFLDAVALSRSQIVAAAIALLDEGGLEHLSLRRLAERLGVGVSTLYWHVRDKRHLLDLVAEAFTADVLTGGPGAGEDVWAWAETWARTLFANLLAHPDGARIMAGNRLSPESLSDMERVLERLAAEGLAPPDAIQALLAIGAYVIGVAVDVQEEANRPPEPPGDFDGYPLLERAGYPDAADRFEGGLRLLLAGIRASVASRR